MWHAAGNDFHRFADTVSKYGIGSEQAKALHDEFSGAPLPTSRQTVTPPLFHRTSPLDPSNAKGGEWSTPEGQVWTDKYGQRIGPTTGVPNPSLAPRIQDVPDPNGRYVQGFQPIGPAPGPAPEWHQSDAMKANAEAARQHDADYEAGRPARIAARQAQLPENRQAQFETDQINQRQGGTSTAEKVATINAKGRVDAANARPASSPKTVSDQPSANTKYSQDALNDRDRSKRIHTRIGQFIAQGDSYEDAYNKVINSKEFAKQEANQPSVQAGQSAPTITSQADYDKLPAGAPFIHDGKPYTKGK